MRKLLYVPIIHTEADLGSMAAAIESASASLSGEGRWVQHRETVSRFWENVGDYFQSHEGADLKIYQDGLAVDGALGRRIIEEAARRGSRNHQIILDLIRRGAEVRKTEDALLLLQEYESYSRAARRPLSERDPDHTRIDRERLTEERDKFIARTINKTLHDGETGVLFIGAYHNVIPHIAVDIHVVRIKDVESVRAYFRALFYGRDETRFKQLAQYLTAPVLEARP